VATAIVSQSVRSSVPYPVQSADDAPRSRASVYEIVTEQVIKQLESGVAPWRKPWRTEMPCNLLSQKPYRGLNVFLLASQGYASRYWLTFNQANKLGPFARSKNALLH
jgi:antirestriction protein ArdC